MPISDKYSRLILVRHGESNWNARGLWTGWKDIDLSEKGRQEAKSAGAVIKDIAVDLAITSDLKRAYHTLSIISQVLNYPNLKIIKDKNVRERNYGKYTGLSKWKIKADLGDEKFTEIRRGWDVAIPEGESLKDVYKRVLINYNMHILPAIKKARNVLYVTHGNTNRALIKHLEKISDDKISSIEMLTGEVIVYQMDISGKVHAKEKRAVNLHHGNQ
ncbi:2,3-bisphosphoglycerate-dependent phosphoglycerate mutase [Candidatus Gottesmanbacteria bacterium]|nr:2,3-bisphosphoglycerate-dependent phosphoglycerate mutase [Candidatus Gottesmanbacteria bacterium]